MPDDAPQFRLRTLFGVTTAVAMTCALVAMLATMPATRVAERLCLLGMLLGCIVGYRRAGPIVARMLVGGLFILGFLLLSAYLALVGLVWQEWNRSSQGFNFAAGLLVICLLTPAATVLTVSLLRAWTWSAYDAHPTLATAETPTAFEGDA